LLEKRRPKTCDHFFCYVPPKKLCELHPLRCNFLIFFLPPLPETKKVLLFTALHKTAQKTSTRRTPRQRWILKDITEETKMKRKDLFLFHFFFFLETSSNFANSMGSGLEAFSHNPRDGSVTPHWLFSQAYTPNIWTSGSSRTRLDYWGDETSSSSFFHFST